MNFVQRLLDSRFSERNKVFFPSRLRTWVRIAKYHTLVLNRNVREGNSLGSRARLLVKELRKKRPTVLFYPETPRSTCPVYQFCLVRGYRMTNNINRKVDLVVRWKDATYYQPGPELCELARTRTVVNIDCNDIGKSHVEAVFSRVFGYSSLVDPREHVGPCVYKSEINGLHDGEIVMCPVESPRPGIYQVLIDNRVGDEYVLDIRVPIIRGKIPFVLLWHKVSSDRFGHWVAKQVIAGVEEVFSPAEHHNLLKFARLMGLDYGDLDVLRDQNSGRMYVIDTNNTPDWERPALPDPGDDVKTMARYFASAFGLEEIADPAAPSP